MDSHNPHQAVIASEFFLEIVEDRILRDLAAAGQPCTVPDIVRVAADVYGEYVGILIEAHLATQKYYDGLSHLMPS